MGGRGMGGSTWEDGCTPQSQASGHAIATSAASSARCATAASAIGLTRCAAVVQPEAGSATCHTTDTTSATTTRQERTHSLARHRRNCYRTRRRVPSDGRVDSTRGRVRPHTCCRICPYAPPYASPEPRPNTSPHIYPCTDQHALPAAGAIYRGGERQECYATDPLGQGNPV